MRRSTVERRRRGLVLTLLLAALGAGVASAQIPGRGPPRLVDVVEISEREGQVDINVVFNCGMRFVTNLPVSQGKEVHIQLVPLPDCGVPPIGQINPEMPPLSGGTSIVAAARLESTAPGQVTLTVTFRQNEHFVLAQGIDVRGVRMRLIDHSRARGKVIVGEKEVVSNFAINLDSRPQPFSPEEIALAHQRLQAPAFVSETVIDGTKWYRLRVGPIERRSEADKLMNRALPDYPRAWLAIGDDAVTSDLSGAAGAAAALPAVERIGTDPPLPPEQLSKILDEARVAMSAHDYPKAIALLTKLQRQPEFPDRARAQELLGLSRERAGQLAHAKAEYQEYLRRYPNGEAAERVALRLKILESAEAKARTGREVGTEPKGWEFSGGFSQLFRYDGQRVTTSGAPPLATPLPPSETATTSNALFTDGDLIARRRGDWLDWIGRFSGGYDKTFVSGSNIAPGRISLASIELLDKPLGLLVRLGRQAGNVNGILGTFDGLFAAWQFSSSWALNAAAGYPVDLLTISPQTQQMFEMVALAYTPHSAHWDGSIFATNQTFDGFTDRRAVGVNARFLASHTTLVGVLDYDIFYHALNTASLVGTLQLPARWNLSFTTEKRNAPVLTTGNALIGQPFTDLTQMTQVFTNEQIYQLARDRTAETSDFSFTATKPLGQRFQMAAIVSANQSQATPASGGVPAQPATGLQPSYQLQFYASDLWRQGDYSVITLLHGETEIGKIDSASLTLRFPLGGAWRLAPRVTTERLIQSSNSSTETSYLPSVLLDYQRGNTLVQLETGAQLGSQEAFLQLQTGQLVQTQNTTSYYVTLSYRISFR